MTTPIPPNEPQPSPSFPSSPKPSPIPNPIGGEAPTVPRLNLKGLFIVSGVFLVIGVGGLGLYLHQLSRGPAAWLAEAERLAEQGRPDLALGFLERVLERQPRHPEALARRAVLRLSLARSPNDLRAARDDHEEAILAAPESPDRQALRRRAVELDLAVGQTAAALNHARDLIARGADDAQAHRLLGEALEATAKVRTAADSALIEARDAYRAALERDDRDLAALEKLADLEALVFRDTEAADALMARALEIAERLAGETRATPAAPPADQPIDPLAKVDPSQDPASRGFASGPRIAARLIRQRHYQKRGRGDLAAFELDEAIKLDPDNALIRRAAAEVALERRDPAAAQRHLDAIPDQFRSSPDQALIDGRVLEAQGRTEEALARWREGMTLAKGGDPALAFQTALTLLRQGRLAEAEPAIAAHRRLTWDDRAREASESARFLQALADLRTRRSARAAEALELLAVKASPALKYQATLALGQAYEQLARRDDAVETYAKAADLEPGRVEPWLAQARLLGPIEPVRALNTLEKALGRLPGNERLLEALAERVASLRRRRFEDPAVRNAVERAAAVAAQGSKSSDRPGLALIRAERAWSDNQPDRARQLLDEALERHPDEPRLILARVETDLRLGRAQAALERLEQSIERGVGFEPVELRSARALCLSRAGRPEAAKAALTDNLDDLTPGQQARVWKVLVELADQEWNDPTTARLAAQSWRVVAPDDFDAHARALDLALASGDLQAAQEATAQLERLDGTGLYEGLNTVWPALITLQRTAGADPDLRRQIEPTLRAAVEQLDQLAQAHPEQAIPAMLSARILRRLNDNDGAIDAARAAVERDGAPASVAFLAELLARGRRLGELDQLALTHPDQAVAIRRLQAEALAAANEADRARELANQLVEADPSNPSLRLWQAKLEQEALDRPDKAEAVLLDLIARRPGETGPWLALLDFKTKRYNDSSTNASTDTNAKPAHEALAELRARALAEAKPDAPMLWKAQVAAVLGDRATAIDAYYEAVRARPDDPATIDEASRFFESTGRLDLAERALKLLVRDFGAAAANPATARTETTTAPANPLEVPGPTAEQAPGPPPRWAVRRLARLLAARAVDGPAQATARRLMDALAAESNTPADRLIRAEVYAVSGDPRQRLQAEAWLDALTRDRPGDLDAHALLARLREQRGDYAGALPHSDALARAGRPDALAYHAGLLIRAGQLDQAREPLDLLLERQPSAPRTLELRARWLHAQGRVEQAIEVVAEGFQTALQRASLAPAAVDLTPTNAAGNPTPARAGSNPNPDSQPQPQPTVAASTASAESARHLDEAAAMVALMARIGPAERAVELARRLVAAWPSPAAAARVGLTLGSIGRADEALSLIRSVAPPPGAENGDTPAARAATNDLGDLAKVALALGASPNGPAEAFDLAETFLNRALAVIPDPARAAPADWLQARAFLNHRRGRHIQEVNDYGDLLRRTPPPRDLRFLNNLAWTLCELLKRPGDALPYIDAAIDRVGWNENLRDTRGVVLTRLGRYAEAAGYLGETIEALGSGASATLHYHHARALLLSGQTDPARAAFARARAAGLDPDASPLQPEERDEYRQLTSRLE